MVLPSAAVSWLLREAEQNGLGIEKALARAAEAYSLVRSGRCVTVPEDVAIRLRQAGPEGLGEALEALEEGRVVDKATWGEVEAAGGLGALLAAYREGRILPRDELLDAISRGVAAAPAAAVHMLVSNMARHWAARGMAPAEAARAIARGLTWLVC